MKFWKGFKSKKNNQDTNNSKEAMVPDLQSESNAGPDPAMGIIFEGLELAKQGNYDESELRYYQITALDPNYSAVWYATSFSNYPNGLDELLSKAFTLGIPVDEKIDAYDAVLSVHPRNTRALMWKGYCLDYLGRYDEGLTFYREALKINPHAIWILTNKLRLDMMFSSNDEVIFTLEALLRINPKDHIALGIMGQVLTDLRRDEEALIFYDKALAIDPNNATLLCGKGTTLDNIRRVTEAFDCFKKGLEIEPDNYCILTNIGVVLQKMDKYTEALSFYDKALKISFAIALYYKARFKATQDEYTEALNLLREAIDSDANIKERAKNAAEFTTMKHDERFMKMTT